MWMVVSLPFGDAERILVEQGSTLVCGTDVNVAATVGSERGVSVDSGDSVGVSVGVSVGGNGVAVGIADCVCATNVNAAATAVFCTSTGSIVGTAGVALHALTKTAIETMSESV